MQLAHAARIWLSVLAIAVLATGLVEAGTLYGSAFSGSDGLADLYTIDPSTGAPTLVGPIKFQRVSAMDFGPDGRLYGIGERDDGTDTTVLLVIDTVTGLGTEVAQVGALVNRPVTDMSFRPADGLLYVFLDGPDQVVTVDHASGAVTVLGFPGTTGGGNALAFSLNLTLYHVEYSSLFRVNQATGVDTPLGALGFSGFPPLGFPKLNAMETDPSSGRIFATVNDGGGGAGPYYLGVLDPLALKVTNVGATVNGLDALAFEPDRCPVALYGAAHVGGSAAPSRFLRIDPITGAATSIGPINFNSVGGIDVHPNTGRIFGVGKRPADGTNVLITIDPVTGAGSEVGPLVNAGIPGSGGLFDLSFRSDGRLFLSGWDLTTPDSTLYVVNQATGFATPIGGMGTLGPGNGIAHSLADSLYFSNNAGGPSQQYLLDETTGAAAFQFFISYSGFPGLASPRLNAMDTDPSTGAVWVAVNDGGGGGGANYLATLDPRLGLVRHVGLSAPGLDAIAWAPLCDDGDPCTVDECVRCQDGELLGAAFSGPNGLATLLKIDPTTGAAGVIGPIGFERVSGMDYDRETGILYATGERADGTNTNVLIAIDPATGAGNEIGPTGLPLVASTVESDISIRPSDGKIYAYLEPFDEVGTIDRLTGAATFLGLSGVSGFGNGIAFDNPGVLYHADGANVNTLNQTTGAATVGPALSYVGFPPPGSAYRVTAIDTNCNGRFFVSVKDNFFGGGGPSYLGLLDQSSGTVSHIGVSDPKLDALTWTGVRGFCRFTFLDSDADTVCDFDDCADLDPSAWAIPPEVTGDTITPPPATDYVWDDQSLIAGPGTVYDLAADTVGALPVGPVEPPGFFLCSVPHIPIGVGLPPPGVIWWVVSRGRNACGVGPYGNERHNDLPPFPLFVPRNTANCP